MTTDNYAAAVERVRSWVQSNVCKLRPDLRDFELVLTRLDKLQAERDRLAAIVAKLPKTADGVVITLGMSVWFLSNYGAYGVERFTVEEISQRLRGTIHRREHYTMSHVLNPSDVYSTRVAAEAASKGKTNG
jgi:hypothetical protein